MEIVIVLVLVLVAAMVLAMVAWALIAALTRVLAWALAIGVGLMVIMFVVGVFRGGLVPIRVFRDPDRYGVDIADPEQVRSGKIFGSTVGSGNGEVYGWDAAWPNYVPWQFRRDLHAVAAAFKASNSRVLRLAHLPHRFVKSWIVRVPWSISVACVWTIPMYSQLVGMWVAHQVWRALLWCLTLLIRLGQWAGTTAVNVSERRRLRRENSTLHCVYCYRDSNVPSYRCPNPSCGQIHHDILPGRLGIHNRICSCGQTIPLSVRRASQVLTPVCPYCLRDQSMGSGARRIVPIPVFGTVGAGKTQFLSTGVLELQQVSQFGGKQFEPLSGPAERFMDEAQLAADASRPPLKTVKQDRPEALPFQIQDGEHQVEIQLLDAAGESFVDNNDTRSLKYLDIAPFIVYVLDPFLFAENETALRGSCCSGSVTIGQGQPEQAYLAVADRLRDDGLNLRQVTLVFVVAKTDVVNQVFVNDPLVPASDDVREWLRKHGGYQLVARIEMEGFREVKYFAVDSVQRDPSTSEFTPMTVIEWIASQLGAGTLLQPPVPDAPEELEPASA